MTALVEKVRPGEERYQGASLDGAARTKRRNGSSLGSAIETLGNTSQIIPGEQGRDISGHVRHNIRKHDPRNISRKSEKMFLSNREVAEANREALREAYLGMQAPTEAIAEDSGASKKAAENWVAGENPQGLTAFINNYRNNPKFAALARYHLLGHTDFDPIVQIQAQNAVTGLMSMADRMGTPAHELAAALQFALANHATIASQKPEGGS